MKAPQIIVIILLGIGLSIAARRHGEQEKKSFWYTLINTAITVGLLWWGGFWG